MAYWIEIDSVGRLAIAPRPRGGDWLEDDIGALKREGVDILVSLLTAEEVAELALSAEESDCERAGIQFRKFAIPDRETPQPMQAFEVFIEKLRQERLSGKNIAAHCRAGIGRSSVVIASLLICEGHSVEQAFQLIASARGMQVPDTREQVAFVERFKAAIETSAH
jgi:protein-tyrosine phosphatase